MTYTGPLPVRRKACERCGSEYDAPRPFTAKYCPTCRPAAKKEREDKWNVKHAARNREMRAAYRARRVADGSAEAGRHRLKLVAYGLTQDQFDALVTAYPVCRVCGTDKDLVIDHDHTTGAVRGCLCRVHNAALGALGDTADHVQRLLDYLLEARRWNG